MNLQSLKKNWIWLALACTLAATAWVSSNGSQPAETLLGPNHAHSPEIKTTRPSQLEPGVTELTVSSAFGGLERTQITSEPHDLFGIDHRVSDQEKAQAQLTAQQMPPMPFIYAGKLMEGDQYTVFLIEGERNLAVHSGDVIDQVWRVKSIHPPQMLLSYLPLKVDATLDIGESN